MISSCSPRERELVERPFRARCSYIGIEEERKRERAKEREREGDIEGDSGFKFTDRMTHSSP